MTLSEALFGTLPFVIGFALSRLGPPVFDALGYRLARWIRGDDRA